MPEPKSEPERIQVIIGCRVEWDKERGVLYVHEDATGATVVRISGLPSSDFRKHIKAGNILDVRAGYPGTSLPVK